VGDTCRPHSSIVVSGENRRRQRVALRRVHQVIRARPRLRDTIRASLIQEAVANPVLAFGRVGSFGCPVESGGSPEEPAQLRACPCGHSNTAFLTSFHGKFCTFVRSTPARLPHHTHPCYFRCTPHISWLAILCLAPMQPSMPTCVHYSFLLFLVHFLPWQPG
jgi:hypothetical protein